MRESIIDRLFKWFANSLVFLFALFCLIPFWLMAAGSITGEKELLLEGYSLFPHTFSFLAYESLARSQNLFNGYVITILVTTVGTLIALIISALFAYSIANRRNRIRGFLAFYVYFTMLFGGGIVPFYILVMNWLKLGDTVWALILPLTAQPFNIFLMVSFFRTIPPDLEESGLMDGANEATIFARLIIPVSKPILATIGLFYALMYWNEWFMGLLFMNDERLFPLQLILRRLISNMQAAKDLMPASLNIMAETPALSIRMATTILTIGPIVLLYPFLQRYFVKGLTVGAIKG
jgi:putative aldouronate transport system permease protein